VVISSFFETTVVIVPEESVTFVKHVFYLEELLALRPDVVRGVGVVVRRRVGADGDVSAGRERVLGAVAQQRDAGVVVALVVTLGRRVR